MPWAKEDEPLILYPEEGKKTHHVELGSTFLLDSLHWLFWQTLIFFQDNAQMNFRMTQLNLLWQGMSDLWPFYLKYLHPYSSFIFIPSYYSQVLYCSQVLPLSDIISHVDLSSQLEHKLRQEFVCLLPCPQ